MWKLLWPAMLIVGSNIAYNIIMKGTPPQVNPFLSLCVTYLISAGLAFGMYFATSEGHGLRHSLGQLGWTSYTLALAILGLEAGYIFFYRAGWNISVGPLVCNIALAVALLIIGALFYKDVLGLKQVAGALLCLCGLVLINLK